LGGDKRWLFCFYLPLKLSHRPGYSKQKRGKEGEEGEKVGLMAFGRGKKGSQNEAEGGDMSKAVVWRRRIGQKAKGSRGEKREKE